MEPTEQTKSRKLRSAAAAAYIGYGVSTLAKMRMRGTGPRYSKGARLVTYDKDDLDRWHEERKRTSTSDDGEGEAA